MSSEAMYRHNRLLARRPHLNRWIGVLPLSFVALLVAILALATGCDSTERSPVPLDKIGLAQIAGIEDIRTSWNDATGSLREGLLTP